MIKQKIATAALVVLGLFVSLDYKSVAQQAQPTTKPTPGATEQNLTNLSALDRQFMIQAAQGGMAEVMLGKLALQRASSQSAKNYARRMIKDHTQANNQLMTLAANKGVSLPKNINEEQQIVMNKLSKLSGKNFDQEYMNEAGLESHAQQVALFQSEVQYGQDPDVKAFATKTLPIVQTHLQMARKMTGTTAGVNQKLQAQ